MILIVAKTRELAEALACDLQIKRDEWKYPYNVSVLYGREFGHARGNHVLWHPSARERDDYPDMVNEVKLRTR